MNHFVSLIIFSLTVSSLFTAVSKEAESRRARYFFTMLAYMIAGSFAAGWLMYFIPW